MPDAQNNFKGISVSAQAWERIFAPKPQLTAEQVTNVMNMVAQMKP
jgi:hypothetical protein